MPTEPTKKAKKPLYHCDLLFTDIETGGLDATKHPLLQIAGLRVRQPTLEIVGKYTSYVRPLPGLVCEESALKVNGINLNSPEMLNAPEESKALVGLAELMRGTIVIGQNPRFDLTFLEPAFKRAKIPWVAIDYHVLDVASIIGWPLVQARQIKTSSLRNICPYFGLSNEGQHDALIDCERTLAVYAEYKRRLKHPWYRLRYLFTGIPF